jgi:hypothetical protein
MDVLSTDDFERGPPVRPNRRLNLCPFSTDRPVEVFLAKNPVPQIVDDLQMLSNTRNVVALAQRVVIQTHKGDAVLDQTMRNTGMIEWPFLTVFSVAKFKVLAHADTD